MQCQLNKMKFNKNKKLFFYLKAPIFISLFFLFFLFTFGIQNIYAVTLNKNIYDYGEDILYQDAVGATMFFDVNSDTANFLGSEHEAGFNINEGGAVFDNGNYIIMEHQSGDNDCYRNIEPTEPYTLKFEECRDSPEFINEFNFTVNTRPPSGGGGGEEPILDEELAPVGHSVTSYAPEVNIFSIFKGALFFNDLNIDYRVIDNNDNGNEKSSQGLIDNPVSIFYSDKITNWYDNFLGSSNKIEIAKNQPKEGKYKWNVKDLIPGVLYKVIVEAIDLAGMWGQGVSEYFGVDFTEPVFTVKVNPPAVKSGDVSIIIDSSEDLSKIPEVKVIQYGGEEVSIVMKGEKSHYEGVYKVISGFDGTAIIKIKGEDNAGNTGEVIISGGTFSVGMNPPPKPKLNNYKEKLVTNEGFVNVSGSIRIDTEAVLNVNGIQISKVKPDEKGNFSFDKIVLDKKKNKGINYINIYARDPLGAMSEGVLIEVKYNIPPTVKILKPITKDIVSNISNIEVEGGDENADTLFYTYQIISSANFNNKVDKWINISERDPSSSFPWNTTEVEDGSYVLRVVAYDGEVESIGETVLVTIKNVLPYFRFEDGRNTITNQSNINIKGKVLTSTNISPRPDIVSVAYSMDQGNTWTPVKITNDGGSYQKKFSVEFTNLKEGIYPILWRTKDSRGFIGKIVHSIIVDKTAPKIPKITNPKLISNSVIVNDSNDENPNKTGIQISINGMTEANSTVTLSYNNKVIKTKALPTGIYSFTNVTFDTKGKYDLKIFVEDLALNKSENLNFSIIYNNLPTIIFLNPKAFRGLSGKANISWIIKDIDGDAISNVLVSYRNKNTDTVFKNLVTNGQAIGDYNWNTNILPESDNYELKITVSDTYSTTSQTISFAIDRTPPILTSFIFNKNQINEKNKEVSFICSGSMTDNLSGVEFVEYQIQDSDGKVGPWYKGLITEGFLKNKGIFSISHPVIALDGDYKVFARAVDSSGNVSEPLSLSLSVDKSSPRIGGFFVEKDGTNILPDETGRIVVYKNSIFSFNISLEEDTESADLIIDNKSFKLEKDLKSQLWRTDISLDEEKVSKLFINAKDNSGNVTASKEIGEIQSSLRGFISIVNDNKTRNLLVGATLQVLKLNKNTNQYEDYIDSSNNEVNAIISNQSGEYDLVLPEGSYQFIIKEPNIKTLKYKYESKRSSIINLNFDVYPVSSFMKLINSFLEIFK